MKEIILHFAFGKSGCVCWWFSLSIIFHISVFRTSRVSPPRKQNTCQPWGLINLITEAGLSCHWPRLTAWPDLPSWQPDVGGCPAAPEEVVVTVALVAGPGEAPARVHPQLKPGTVLSAGPGTHHPQVPVLPAGDKLQLAGVPIDRE